LPARNIAERNSDERAKALAVIDTGPTRRRPSEGSKRKRLTSNFPVDDFSGLIRYLRRVAGSLE
jgi:hypothetical protein